MTEAGDPAETYAASHRDRVNLWFHLLAVPLFVVGSIAIAWSALQGQWLHVATGFAIISVSMALQGIGHRRETVPPEPFRGPRDFVTRIFREQFMRFPGFVLSGKWLRNLRDADNRP